MTRIELETVIENHLIWLTTNQGAQANLAGADLSEVDLSRANLSGADLSGANLDYASWPLWCGSANVTVDARLARQLLAHAFAVAKQFCPPTPEQVEFMNRFHRIERGEFPRLDQIKEGEKK